jgi:hypothetical protein
VLFLEGEVLGIGAFALGGLLWLLVPWLDRPGRRGEYSRAARAVGVVLIVYLVGGYSAPNALRGLGLMWINVILLLNVSLLGGAMLSTLANGVLVFGMYGIAFLGGWIEQFGSLVKNQTAINIGIISSLIIPSEALWKRAAYEMQSPLVQALGFSPFTSGSVPSNMMIAYAIFYAGMALLLAVRQFRRRDL